MKKTRSQIAAVLLGVIAATLVLASVQQAVAQNPDDLVNMCGNGRTIQVRFQYQSFFNARGYTNGPCTVTQTANQ